MKKRHVKRWIAIFCAILILPWSLWLSGNPQSVDASKASLTEWTIADAGLADGNYTSLNNNETTLTDTDVSLIGTAFTTMVKFDSGNFWIGSGYSDTPQHRGFYIQPNGGNLFFEYFPNGERTTNSSFTTVTNASTGASREVLTPEKAGVTSFTDEINKFTLTVQEDTEDEDDNESRNIKVGIWFNDQLYDKTYFYVEGSTSTMPKSLAFNWGDSIYLAKPASDESDNKTDKITSPDDLTAWTPEDAHITYGVELANMTGGTVNAAVGSLNGTVFKSRIDFPSAAEIGSGNVLYINIGGAAGKSSRTYVLGAMADGDYLRLVPYSGGTAQDADIQKLTPADFGMEGTTLLGQELDVMITTEFENVKSESGVDKADVRLGIYINGTLYKGAYVVLKDYTITNFKQQMQVEYSSAVGPIFYALGGTSDEPNPTPEQVTSPDALEVWTPEDANVAYNATLPHSTGGTASKEDASLNGTAFKTQVIFPDTLESGQSINFWIGGTEGKTYVIQAEGGKDTLTFMHYPSRTTSKITLNPNDYGLTSLVGEKLELIITTEFVGYTAGDAAADVNVGLYINGVLYGGRYIRLEDQTAAEFRKQIQIKTYPTTVGGPILNPPEGAEPENYRDDADNVEIDYDTTLTFLDFGITRDLVTSGKQIAKMAGNETLDSVMIDGVYHLEGNACFDVGGTWAGLQVQRSGSGDTMRYSYVDRYGKSVVFYKEVTSEETGCQLFGADVRIQTGFTFKKMDVAAGTADVTVEIRIGNTYRDVFTVKGVLTSNLQRCLFIYAREEGSALTLKKPYMEPFDFTEFGFTKNYLKELNLMRKLEKLGIVI